MLPAKAATRSAPSSELAVRLSATVEHGAEGGISATVRHHGPSWPRPPRQVGTRDAWSRMIRRVVASAERLIPFENSAAGSHYPWCGRSHRHGVYLGAGIAWDWDIERPPVTQVEDALLIPAFKRVETAQAG